MPDQERVRGEDGKEYIVLPSGRRFPAEELDGLHSEFGALPTSVRIAKMIFNPETMGTIASVMAPETGGASMLIPAAAGATWSVGEDLLGGNRDPRSIAGHALMHGAANAVPGAIRGMVSEGASAMPFVGAAARAVGGWKGQLLSTLTGGVGQGAAAGSGTAATAQLAPELASAVLPGGIRLASAEGVAALKGALRQLALKGAAYGHPQFDALDTLIRQVEPHVTSQLTSPANLLKQAGQAGLSLSSMGAANGGRIANALRALLAGGSAVNEAAR